jgi:hypothetical protein
MERAGEERLLRLRELVDDCTKILNILETNAASGEQHFWSVYEKYSWAKGPGKGETASLWYRMRLYALRLWDESGQILR